MNKKYSDSIKYPHFSEEHDYGNAFWIKPVMLSPLRDFRVRMSDVIEIDDEISIPAQFVDTLLYPLFLKHFESNMLRNVVRVGFEKDDQIEYVKGFDYNLTYNFYTYECMRLLLNDISIYSESLKNGNMDKMDERTINGIKKLYSDYGDLDQVEYYDIVAIFYKNLVTRLQKMIDDHPETDMISVMGP